MYLISQMALYLFAAFLTGIGIGYALWRSLGEREVVARFHAAELRLAAQLARYEKSMAHVPAVPQQLADTFANEREAGGMRWQDTARRELHEFEAKQAALLKEAEHSAIRKAEAAAEKRLAEFARKFGQDTADAARGVKTSDETRGSASVISLSDAQADATAEAKHG